ncbi:hypothetical protein EDEG_01945 [Edhazardia aedis USNM 41457]|uniref:Uncharacterized protein n=1 Tax=Edhazardia aedis (strain USNM 41457) TaxID=1003232 RepID=J9DMC8_EDHAE|nr:hypothetical protein EDEG_01945 [Edhazardia aedis USNM 41457]|eukprot:EJW03750.1 hypothetical protein EDEG_01945 [Edhazardia aedis USNM 41457]
MESAIPREFTPKELKVYQSLTQKHNLIKLKHDQFTIKRGSIQHVVKSPLCYQIEGTKTIVVFGKVDESYDIDKMRQNYLRKLIEMQKNNPEIVNELRKIVGESGNNQLDQLFADIGAENQNKDVMTDVVNETIKKNENVLQETANKDNEDVKVNFVTKPEVDPSAENENTENDVSEINEENVKYLVHEFKISKEKAITYLKEHEFDVKKAAEFIKSDRSKKNKK